MQCGKRLFPLWPRVLRGRFGMWELNCRRFSDDKLRVESTGVIAAALEVRESYKAFSHQRDTQFTNMVERTLDRLSRNHSIDVHASEQEVPNARDMEKWLKEDEAGPSLDPVFFLSKSERPPLPCDDNPESPKNPVILNWYTTPLSELRKFARARKIPLGSKKITTFLNILRRLGLPLNTVYIRESDLSRNAIALRCYELWGLRHTSRIHTLNIRFPKVPVVDGCLPISDFIYVDTNEAADAVADLLLDESLVWQLGPEIFDARSSGSPTTSANNSTDLPVSSPPPSTSSVPCFQEIHPQLPAVSVLRGLAVRTKSEAELVGVDTETTGLDPHTSQLRLLSLSWTGFPTVIVDVLKLFPKSPDVMGAPGEKTQLSRAARRLLSALVYVLEKAPITKVFFNGKFDYKFLLKHLGIKVAQPLRDVMLSTALLEAGRMPAYRHYNLNAVVAKELNFSLPLPRTIAWVLDEGWKDDTLPNDQLVYASRDAAVLPYIMEQVATQLERAELEAVNKLESQCLPAVAEMEFHGVIVDFGRWKALTERLKEDVASCERTLRKALGWTHEEGRLKNIDSPKQLLEAFREIQRNACVSQDNVATAKLHRILHSTCAKSLTELDSLSKEVVALLNYRKSRKLQSTCLSQFLHSTNPATGRVHASFNQLGAASGRFSCENPNLQQVPRLKEFRHCFRAQDGCVFIVADFSQIELRIAADIAPDKRMIEAFSQNEDLHLVTASLLKGVPPSEATKSDRQLAKAVNFGLLYGISPRGLKQYARQSYDINMTLEEATAFRKAFFQHYVGLAEWHKRITTTSSHTEMENHVVTRTRSNRRALFSHTNIRFQQLLNYPVQGTSADIVKETLVRLHQSKTMQALKARVVLCVHDEVVVEVPEPHAEETLHLVTSIMEEAGNHYLKHVHCAAEGAIGSDWSFKP